jgi:hypothetical protein
VSNFIPAPKLGYHSLTYHSPDSCQKLIHKSSQITVPIPQQEPKILSLPNELIGAILLESPDVPTAIAMSQTSRIFRDEYTCNEKKILYRSLLSEMGFGLLTEALVVHIAGKLEYTSKNHRKMVEDHIKRYVRGQSQDLKLGAFSVKDLRDIFLLHRDVQGLATYSHFDLYWRRPVTGRMSPVRTNSSLLKEVCRSIYFLEHFCRLFEVARATRSVFIHGFSDEEMTDHFLAVVPPSQNEKLLRIQKSVFNNIADWPGTIPNKFHKVVPGGVNLLPYTTVLRWYYDVRSYTTVQSQT